MGKSWGIQEEKPASVGLGLGEPRSWRRGLGGTRGAGSGKAQKGRDLFLSAPEGTAQGRDTV